MDVQQKIDFDRIRCAIEYIDANFREQPSLNKVAAHVNLSPFHFQRMFTEWSGVSPKQFVQYTSVEYAKRILRESKLPLADAACAVGLSGTGRLHDMFVTIEGMTPGEYKNGGKSLTINYTFTDSPFGTILIASTPKGVCYIAFVDNEADVLNILKSKFPNAVYVNTTDRIQQEALLVFTKDWSALNGIKLHIKGTAFQMKIWEALLRIPMGSLVTYKDIARYIENPGANRAVGTAIGQNPVSFLIPCHRVIQSTGAFGGYMWGPSRKKAMIGWEGAQVETMKMPADV
ncbi:MAG: methylated-DNA--[protein]-cysteine S-methyltransferase [Proteiniphilum sp.]|jgi:AraC family transcriptional regulator of adaptative response/methylated-DNA-[protein]-cysteine methyltransferase|nr:methylated-DNA--[protein]-cysteine S-methyltransferase [Proteiniphilum sp.]